MSTSPLLCQKIGDHIVWDLPAALRIKNSSLRSLELSLPIPAGVLLVSHTKDSEISLLSASLVKSE